MLKIIVASFFSKMEEVLYKKTGENIVRDINHNLTLQTLERNLNSLSARAFDVEDEIKNAMLSGKKKRKQEVENWLEEVKKLGDEIGTLEGEVQSEGFVSRFLGGDRAAKLKERIVELVEQSRHFGELVLDVRETRGEELLTTRLVGKAFEENLERIWKFLRVDNVKSIGIHGMGGVGKTTLAKHINNQLLEETQESAFWITVSQESSIRMLQDEIAKVIGLDLSHEHDENKRAARLYQAFISLRKNFVLILDDVWKNISLEKAGDPLRVEGCRLIITTRSLQVCRQIGCQQVIPVKTLDADESWDLFRRTLGQETTLASQVEEIAKSMAEVCDGLPLGIITLAGSMRGEISIHVWRNALTELRKSVMEHDDMEDQVFKVLKYSFDRLDPKHQRRGESNEGYTKLQLCFLYCSLYPEDWAISRGELLRKFISEELVDKRKGRGAQFDEGHTILNKLVNVCLLGSAKNESGFDSVKMHDLVRAMALKITQGKNMVFARSQLNQIPKEEEYWTKDLEKISLMRNSIKEIPDGISPACPNFSTLLLHENYHLKFIADSFFSQMHGLCVLDLSGTSITKLPNSISELENLKTLLLGYCERLECFPYLGKLEALKELDLSNTAIKEVPQGMDKLVNLKFLSMARIQYLPSLNRMYALEALPTGLLLNFPHLQCLRLPYQILIPIEEIERMEQLEEFQGRVDNVSDFNRFIRSRQQSHISYIRYSILVGNFTETDDHLFVYNNQNNLLVHGCNLREDVPILAHDVGQLVLKKCEGLSKCLLDDFPLFNNPKSLNSLNIINCEGIECILTSDLLMTAKKEELESHCLPLGTLQAIELWDLPNFIGIIHKQEIEAGVALPTPAKGVFLSLRYLTIVGCVKMKKLGLRASEFPNLESISLNSCEDIEEIIAEGEGEAGIGPFPKLRCLGLCNLPRLKSICKATTISDSIENIHIVGCPALEKIPLYFPLMDGGSSNYSYSPPPPLKEISLRRGEVDWWESLEWEHPSYKHLLQPYLKFV